MAIPSHWNSANYLALSDGEQKAVRAQVFEWLERQRRLVAASAADVVARAGTDIDDLAAFITATGVSATFASDTDYPLTSLATARDAIRGDMATAVNAITDVTCSYTAP